MNMENLEERIRWQQDVIRSTKAELRSISDRLQQAQADHKHKQTIESAAWLAHLRGYERSTRQMLHAQEESLRTLTMRREYELEKEPVHGVSDAGLDAKDLP